MDRNAVFQAFAGELAEMIVERIKLRAEKRLYTVQEAAAYLACSEEQLDNYVKSGKLRRTMTDRRPRYDLGDLDRFVDSARLAGRR